jgi:hypothetical protein
MASVEGPMHIVRYVNPAFCRLIGGARDAFAGRPFREMLPEAAECLALLDRVYRTGKPESCTEQDRSGSRPVSWSYAMWPVMAQEQMAGVMMQVTETVPLYEKTIAMNEALILGSLRQHELTELATTSNSNLQIEIGDGKQREHDAHLLTREISHRIKNNLQIVIALIAYEAKMAAAL